MGEIRKKLKRKEIESEFEPKEPKFAHKAQNGGRVQGYHQLGNLNDASIDALEPRKRV